MSATGGESEEEPLVSHIACHNCRRRKIKCDRELPHCKVCERAAQSCEYPAKILKPGPKIGSTQRTRKRRRPDRETEDDIAVPSSKTNSVTREPSRAESRKSSSSSTEQIQVTEDARDIMPLPEISQAQNMPDMELTSPRDHSINIHDLSFILHPAHEDSMSETNSSPKSVKDRLENGRAIMAARASYALGITPEALEEMVRVYFENMTAINIFHEPTFEEKIRNIGSGNQVNALVASVLAFSARFCNPENHDGQECAANCQEKSAQKSAYFFELASRFADDALRECGDEAPPLCVVQALALIAHIQLSQGVRGKAWRSLGTCVRLAYELNLHLVDAAQPPEVLDSQQWCDDEEKRRTWWAIWEMDVFASTVRRCPTAVDWSQIETLLPVEDEYWFTSKPQASCFLEPDPLRRLKALQDSGNHSPKAWFIVINSLMKEAQSISSPRGIPNPSSPAARRPTVRPTQDQSYNAAVVEEANEKLETLTNAVYCFVMALPPHLRYRNQFLGFDARRPGQISSPRQQHCGIYNIFVMTELAKLMIHHYNIFGESAREYRTRDKQQGGRSGTATPTRMNSTENLAMNQYFEAADEILKIVRRSSDDHIKWINNFLSSTIWLASAVQLVRKEFGPPGTNRSLIKSKFEVLNMTYKKCVSFWGIQTAMQRNLETLELQLEKFRISVTKNPEIAQQKAYQISHGRRDSWTNGLSLSVGGYDTQHEQAESRSAAVQSCPGEARPFHNLRESGNLDPDGNSHQQSMTAPATNFGSQSHDFHSQENSQHGPQPPSQGNRTNVAPLSPALSVLDFMHLSSNTDAADGGMAVSPSCALDQESLMYQGPQEGHSFGMNNDPLQGMSFGMHLTGWNSEIPNYIDELLSGGCQY